MKHLLLLRHAKAVPGEHGMADRERGLASKGRGDATLIGTRLAEYPPDAVLCSPARRTRETLEAALAELPEKPSITYVEALYGSAHDYVDIIATSGATADYLLVVGHNPALHETAIALVGSGRRKLRDDLAARFTTGTLATIVFDASDWSEIRPGAGELTALVRPKDLGAHSEDG